jgi:hypothetical protein
MVSMGIKEITNSIATPGNLLNFWMPPFDLQQEKGKD